MFEKIVVTRNKDNTFRLYVSGYRTKEDPKRSNILIHKLRDMPLEIEQTPTLETSKYFTPLVSANNYRLKIETQLFPNRNGEIAQIRTKPKARRIRN